MQYMGSKNRLCKEIVPIIQSYINDNKIENYLESFVGGANVIDKIKCKNKYGCDLNKYLIALLDNIKNGWLPPKEVSEELYNKILKNICKEFMIFMRNKDNKLFLGKIGEIFEVV